MSAKKSRLRTAGAHWRVLAHHRGPIGDTAEPSLSIETYPSRHSTEHTKVIDVSGTELDEVVVGSSIHLEQMDTGTWWMNIGGVVVWIKADRDGRPLQVDVYGPHDYDQPVEGCEYKVTWTEEIGG